MQRELTTDMAIEADYFHRDIRNLLGIRNANIAFESRVLGRRFLPPFTTGTDHHVRTVLRRAVRRADRQLQQALQPPLHARRQLHLRAGHRQFARDQLSIRRTASSARCPAVTETATGRSNANGEFTRANGTLVQAAGTFLNGPDRDKGPSDLSIDHVFQANGMVELPYQIQVSGIFRAQSGFHFSQAPASGVLVDPDGDASVNAIDVNAGRNAFTTPPFVNLDMRFAKRFNITSRRQGAGAARVLQRVQPPESGGGRPPAGRGARAVWPADAGAARDGKGSSVSGSSSDRRAVAAIPLAMLSERLSLR